MTAKIRMDGKKSYKVINRVKLVSEVWSEDGETKYYHIESYWGSEDFRADYYTIEIYG